MTNLAERAYALLRKIPKGKVTTYKELGKAMGTTAYRAVGQAMKMNPDAPQTPCHRVVRSDGRLGGYMGETKGEGIKRKRDLLLSEGVKVEGDRVDLEKVKYVFEK